jgi:hypothetical protein
MKHACRLLIVTLLLGTAVSTLRNYPHELAYFNEAAGGPENGHRHLLHSNLDWGQDLLFLRDLLEESDRLDQPPLLLVSKLFYDPRDLGIHCKPLDRATDVDEVRPIAFGVTTLLEGAGDSASGEQIRFSRFARLTPSFRAGYSIRGYE